MLVFNMVIIFLHARKIISLYASSVVASVASMHLWVNLFLWLRIKHDTAIYVNLILQTIIDLRWFMLTFIMCISAFANAVTLINGAVDISTDDHTAFYRDAFDVSVLDAWVDQYLLSLGEFSFPWHESNAGWLMWLYFLMATYIS